MLHCWLTRVSWRKLISRKQLALAGSNNREGEVYHQNVYHLLHCRPDKKRHVYTVAWLRWVSSCYAMQAYLRIGLQHRPTAWLESTSFSAVYATLANAIVSRVQCCAIARKAKDTPVISAYASIVPVAVENFVILNNLWLCIRIKSF